MQSHILCCMYGWNLKQFNILLLSDDLHIEQSVDRCGGRPSTITPPNNQTTSMYRSFCNTYNVENKQSSLQNNDNMPSLSGDNSDDSEAAVPVQMGSPPSSTTKSFKSKRAIQNTSQK